MATTISVPQAPPRRPKHPIWRAIGYLLAFLLTLVLVLGGWGYWRVRRCLPQLDGTIRVAGLRAPVTVLRDTHGVPHLRAQSLDDLLYAQGYITAQDRLFQMDLSRRLAEGELAEIVGERALKLDIEARTLGLPQVLRRAAAEFDDQSRRLMDAYDRGVNAYISSHTSSLPVEFAILHYQPRPWRTMDSMAVGLNMFKALSTTWQEDLVRERVRAKVGPDLYADLFPDHSPLDRPVAELLPQPDGPHLLLKPAALSPLSSLRTAEFEEQRRPATNSFNGSGAVNSALPFDPILVAQASTGEIPASPLGSNNWVVNGQHTQTGKPLLANDPHLGHRVPSVWYMIHLKAPGLNVSGVSLPGFPLVVIGHNERIAWGMTNTGPDVQDLYMETFNPQDPKQYRRVNEWVQAEEREETIKVRGEQDYRITVRATYHGPIISPLIPQQSGGRALALRWTAFDPGALRFTFLNLNRAENWQQFMSALREWVGPEQNFVYADVDGNIGYYAPARIPIRKQGDGSVPVPGDTGEYDWIDYVPFEKLPHAYNPASGIIATANGRVVPDEYTFLITHQWEPPYRTARIFQLLEQPGKRFTVSDMMRVQADIHSLDDMWLAAQLVGAGDRHPPETPDAQYALSTLRGWEGEAQADSAATLVCEVTSETLLKRILRPKLGDDLSGYNWPMRYVFLSNVVEGRLERWLPPGDADFDVTLIKSLEEAVRQIPYLVRSHDHAAWRWGDTIPLTFHHPLGGASPLLARLFDVGPFSQSGTARTVKATTSHSGPSMRIVDDLSDLDNSVQVITLGESGQIFSPYYRDQFETWYGGANLPMPFSDSAVDKGTVHRLVLEKF
jgi:penicillin G amidase